MMSPFLSAQLPGRTITHENRNYLFFSGTAYLGLPQHPAFQQLVQTGMARYGTAYGSSRNGNLQLDIYAEAEAKLAAFAGAPAALTLSSGMLAGQVVVNWLRSQSGQFVYGPNAHPALWHEPVLQLPGSTFTDWVRQLRAQLRALPPGPVAILVNSVDAARSGYYAFDWVSQLPDNHNVTVVVDDSHGLGVLGAAGGRGIYPQIPPRPGVRLLVTASLAKAMGLPGGVVLGDANTLATLRQTAFFGACSPMPPVFLHAFVRADALYADALERLHENLKLAEKLLLPTGLFSHATGYPVFFSEEDDLYPFLLERGMFVYSFAYPTAADRPATRLIISAYHTFDDIQQLASAVYDYCF